MGFLSQLGKVFQKPSRFSESVSINPKTYLNRKRLDVAQRFSNIHKLKSGSTCQFFKVQDAQTGSQFGLKVVHPEKIADFRSRFRKLQVPSEGEMTAVLQHPSIVSLVEYGLTKAGEDYLLLEWVDGPRLDQAIEKQAQLTLADRLHLVGQMLESLQFVHQSGILHRDVCPRNFLCDGTLQRVKLFDFGCAMPDRPETRAHTIRIGTPMYMAPEVIRRRAVGCHTDLFSFGVSAFHLITGQHPWGIEDNSSKSALLFDTRPPQRIQQLEPQLNDRIASALDRCLAADPAKRFQSCRHFQAAAGDLRLGGKS